MRFLKGIYLTSWFFIVLTSTSFVFVMAFLFPFLFIIAQAILAGFVGLVLIEILLLYLQKKPFTGERRVMNPLSLGDDNKVSIIVTNKYNFPVRAVVYDNPPHQLQLRDLHFTFLISPKESKEVEYYIHPNERGVFEFGKINVFSSVLLHLIQRKYQIDVEQKVAVHPSILQMKKMELKVFAKTAISGIKNIRRLGNNSEFEQIKNYVQGDDFRTINWKATSRRNELMVNQYQDERAQNVYSVIDKSRTMRMPFNNLTLLDYAINSTLAFSNIILRKGDKVGLMTYSNKLGAKLKAERNGNQLRKIMELLYHQKTQFLEANFNLLYQGIRNYIKGRSLIMLYTNIDSEYSLKRILPLLKRINQKHLLVVIFFENTEIAKTSEMNPKTIGDIYLKTFAEKHHIDKKKISLELRKNGIQTILTKPENLSVDTINKYLELKARGMI
jgi:uncharacterized protein (DUF58 family)